MSIFWPGSLIFGFPGVMAPYWQETFQVGSAATGNIMFFILAAVGSFMYLAGRWQERVGARLMIRLGVLLCGFNLFTAAYANSIGVIYLWAFISGISSCLVYVPALTTVQNWFPARRGLVTGIVNLCFGLSAAIMSPLFYHMLQSMGYLSMNVTLAIVFVILGLVAAGFTGMPEKIQPATAIIGEQTPQHKVEEVLPPPSLTVKESVRTKNFYLLWLTWAMQGSAGIAMVTLAVVFGIAKGHSPAAAVLILTAFNLSSGLSRIVSGYLSDYTGRTGIMSLTFLAAGMSYFFLPHTGNLIFLLMLAAIIGFAFGTLFAVSAPLVSDCFGLKHFGVIFGLVFTGYGFVSGLLGPSLSGYLLDLTAGNFTIVFSYLGVLCLVSGLLIRFINPDLKVPANPHPESAKV